MKSYKYIFVLLVLFTLPASTFDIQPFSPQTPLLKAFAKNCLQATQAQQLLKAYLLIGLNSNFGNPKKNLKEAIPAYDQRLEAINMYFKKKLGNNKEAKKALDDARLKWRESKVMLEQPPTIKNALKIRENFFLFREYLIKGTNPLSGKKREFVRIMGDMCIQPFYFANLYLLKAWGAKLPQYDKEIKNIIDTFLENHKKTIAFNYNTQESSKLLKSVNQQFWHFVYAYKLNKRPRYTIISNKADLNFAAIIKIKKLLKKSLDKQK